MRLRSPETQTPTTEQPFIDPMAAQKAGYGPLHGPPAPGEVMGPVEVAPLPVEQRTLSVNGLRQAVTELRAKRAERKAEKHAERAKKAHKRAEQMQDSFERVMNGTAVPYETSRDKMEKPSPIDKLDRLAREVKHPNRVSKPSDSYSATANWRHNRAVKKMVDQRNKRRKFELEAEAKHRWFGRAQTYDQSIKKQPYTKSGDLGTPLGWNRFYQVPRTGLEVRGYRRAIEQSHHELHKAHKITEKVHKKVEKAEAKAKKYDAKLAERRTNVSKLERRKTTIANREDRASKLYDGSKRQVQARWSKSKAGYKAAPAAFREGRQGTNVPDTRTQRTINKTARGVGLAIGTVKREYKPSNIKRSVQRDMESIRAWRANRAAEAGRPTKDERKRQKQAAKARRQAQNRRGVL